MNRKHFLILISVIVLIVLTACGGGNSNVSTDANGQSQNNNNSSNQTNPAEEISLRLGHVTDQQDPYHLAAANFAERVEEKSNGTIKITVFPAGQLGGEVDMIEMVQNGSLDAALISSSVFSSQTPVFDALMLPFLIDDYDTFEEALKSETVQKMLDSLQDINLKGLAINESGFRHIGSNVSSVQSVEDLQGLKIRVPQSPIIVDIFNTLGASPTPIPYPEVYSSLQTGVIDAHENNLSAYNNAKFHEVTEYITLSKHYPWPNTNIINLEKFNSFTPEQQQILQEAATETSAWIITQLKERNENEMKILLDLGQNISEIENIQPFIDKVRPVYDKYAEKDPIIQEFIDVVENIKNNK